MEIEKQIANFILKRFSDNVVDADESIKEDSK